MKLIFICNAKELHRSVALLEPSKKKKRSESDNLKVETHRIDSFFYYFMHGLNWSWRQIGGQSI